MGISKIYDDVLVQKNGNVHFFTAFDIKRNDNSRWKGYNIECEGQTINATPHVKYLGLTIDRHLDGEEMTLSTIKELKGTGHDFFWSGTPMNHFQKQGKIHINQKKQLNPCKIDKIMKKKRFWQVFHSCF